MKKVNYMGLLLVTLLFASCDLDKSIPIRKLLRMNM